MASTCAATFSASCSASCGASANSTLATPAIWLACFAASAAFSPAISTCTSPPHWVAAVTVFKVAPFKSACSCSATTRTAISDHLRFVLQLRDQRRDIGHLHAGAALGGLRDLQRLDARAHVHTEVGGLHHFERLLLRLHDVGQRDVARLVH